MPGPEKLAVLLTVQGGGGDYWEGMDTNHVQVQRVSVSVACGAINYFDKTGSIHAHLLNQS